MIDRELRSLRIRLALAGFVAGYGMVLILFTVVLTSSEQVDEVSTVDGATPEGASPADEVDEQVTQNVDERGDGVDPAMGHGVRGVDRTALVVVAHHMQLGAALAPSQLVECGVGGDPVHPGAERRSAVESVEVAHDADHGLLRRVVGVTAAARDPSTDRMNTVVVPPEQLVHRGRVASPGRCDEIVVGRARRGHGAREISPSRPR